MIVDPEQRGFIMLVRAGVSTVNIHHLLKLFVKNCFIRSEMISVNSCAGDKVTQVEGGGGGGDC